VTRAYAPHSGLPRSAGADDLDASLLLGVLFGFDEPRSHRGRGTIEPSAGNSATAPSCTAIRGAMGGGFIGTLVLTTWLRAASELRLTRIDLPFLLGTAVTADRLRAKALG